MLCFALRCATTTSQQTQISNQPPMLQAVPSWAADKAAQPAWRPALGHDFMQRPRKARIHWLMDLHGSLPTQEKAQGIHLTPSCCTQGKGLGFGAVADFVHSLKIVVANGTVITYDAAHPHFNEARMNFGLMGVIVEITFSLCSKRVLPEEPLVQDANTFPTLREVFGRPDAGAYIKARPAPDVPGCSPAQILPQEVAFQTQRLKAPSHDIAVMCLIWRCSL